MSDPWAEIAPPLSSAAISARRVDETSPWDFYWAYDSDRHCMLILRHEPAAAPRQRLPRLRGVDVSASSASIDDKPTVVLKLIDSTLRDIFYKLCIDIIASTTGAASEAEAVGITVARTWRWHHLLRGGGSGLLDLAAQQGLIAELLVLEGSLLNVLAPFDSVSSWRGPLGAPKDFIAGRTAIESKACGESGARGVFVNSEYQLDDADVDSLFLNLTILELAAPEDVDAFTLTDVASRIEARLALESDRATERYVALLEAAGYREDDDYSPFRWLAGEQRVYRVSEGFPRLTPANVPAGVTAVTYLLSPAQCSPFLVARSVLQEALMRERRGE